MPKSDSPVSVRLDFMGNAHIFLPHIVSHSLLDILPFFRNNRRNNTCKRNAVMDERKATIASNLIRLRLAAGMTQA